MSHLIVYPLCDGSDNIHTRHWLASPLRDGNLNSLPSTPQRSDIPFLLFNLKRANMPRCNMNRVKSSLFFWIFILAMMTRRREMAQALLATSISASSRTLKMPENMTVSKYSPSVEENRSPRTTPLSRGRSQFASVISPQTFNLSAFIKVPPVPYTVECFDNISRRLGAASAEDCRVVVDHVILGYANPMDPKTFGWNDGKSMSERRVPCLMIKPGDSRAQKSHTAKSRHQKIKNSMNK